MLHDVVCDKGLVRHNMAAVVESAVQFAPYSSAVDAAFWHRLTQNKLEIYQLDDKPKPLQGYYVNSKSSFKKYSLFVLNFGKVFILLSFTEVLI